MLTIRCAIYHEHWEKAKKKTRNASKTCHGWAKARAYSKHIKFQLGNRAEETAIRQCCCKPTHFCSLHAGLTCHVQIPLLTLRNTRLDGGMTFRHKFLQHIFDVCSFSPASHRVLHPDRTKYYYVMFLQKTPDIVRLF